MYVRRGEGDKMNGKTLKLCVTAMGIALFVALSVCLKVPVFENYYLCLGYLVMEVYCYSFGALYGTAVGTLGVVLYCLVISGLRGMPGWALGNVVIGIVLGLTFGKTRNMSRHVAARVIEIAAIVLSAAAGILGVKSLTESVLYLQPFLVRAAKNSYAFIADAVVLIIGLPFAVLMDGKIRKKERKEGIKQI